MEADSFTSALQFVQGMPKCRRTPACPVLFGVRDVNVAIAVAIPPTLTGIDRDQPKCGIPGFAVVTSLRAVSDRAVV